MTEQPASIKNKFFPLDKDYLLVFAIWLSMFTLPLLNQKNYILNILIIANILIIFTVSWDIMAGLVGQLNLGHAMFFGVGAYTAAFLNKETIIPPAPGILIGGLVAVVFGLILGIPCLRLRGPYLIIVTLAAAEILFLLVNTLSKFTGGDEGITGIRMLVRGPLNNYYLITFFSLVVVCLTLLLSKSKIGLVLKAIRENELLAEAIGVNLIYYKLTIYCLSAFLSGIAGAYYCHYLGIVTPETLSLNTTFSAITMVAIGGLGTIVGPVIGTLLLTTAFEQLTFLAEYRVFAYSLFLLLVILFLPHGLYACIKNWLEKVK